MSKRFGRIECADGFSMSVQASSTHYCSPREDNADWYRVEVGFPSSPEPLLLPYASSSDVYGYVPVEIVDAVIEKHGGIKEEDSVSIVDARHKGTLVGDEDKELHTVSAICSVSGQEYTVSVPMSDWRLWQAGQGRAKQLFPQLTDDQRRFLIAGETPLEAAAIAALVDRYTP